ncbi:MAG: MFS transporter [Polyangiales bacterium]
MNAAHRRIAVACVLGGLVLVVLDAAVVNVALPAIADAHATTPASAVRVVTAYQMALVMALLPCAALGEARGPRRVYAGGVALFLIAAAVGATARSLSVLIAARFAQGLGGAAVMSLGVALLRQVVPPARLGAAIGWNALAVALGSASGPTVGALLLTRWSWRAVFVVGLPLGSLVLLATRALPREAGHGRPVDGVSIALHGATFAAAVTGAALLSARLSVAIALLGSAAVLGGALVRRELPRAAPLVPLDLLRDRSFRASVSASVCVFVAQSAAMVALPFELRERLDVPALRTGLLITPWPVAVALVAPLAGRLADRVSGAWLCALGAGLLAAGLTGVARATDGGALLPFVALSGVGFGLFQVPNNRSLLLAASPGRSGAAGGMQATARLTGQVLGALVMTALFARTSRERAPHLGLLIAAALALLGGLVSAWRAPGRADLAPGRLPAPRGSVEPEEIPKASHGVELDAARDLP